MQSGYALFSRSSVARRGEPRLYLSAERVGILDDIGSASGRGARGKQHEALGRKRLAREIAAQREIVGNILARGVIEPRERYMRNEFAPFRIEANTLHHPFQFRLHLDQWPARHDGGNHRA